MKLQRFTATNNHKAILKIHEALGPDALIYSTRTIPDGVEIMAGLPYADSQPEQHVEWPTIISAPIVETEVKTAEEDDDDQCNDVYCDETYFEKASSNFEIVEKLNSQLNYVDEKINRIAKSLDNRFLESVYIADDDKMIKKNLLYYFLSQMGFRGKFCNKFVNYYLRQKNLTDHISQESVLQVLLKLIKTSEKELIDEKNICALIGPAGTGKTTTIAKIANRYINKYGSSTISLITLDYHDIATKNYLYYFSNQFNIDLDFASNPKELSLILAEKDQKNLILIDTAGVSQRDQQGVMKTLNLLESQGNLINCYLTLPCHVQEPVLDEVVRSFNTPNLAGCILTKQDECINIAPALSISLNYKLPIFYVANGRNVNEHLTCASSESILHFIVNESREKKILVEEYLEGKAKKVTNCKK